MKQKNTFARYWAAFLLISILLPVFIVEGCREHRKDYGIKAIHGAVLNPQGHVCRWNDCPYKGVKKHNWEQAVTRYVGEDAAGSDAWCIDVLHLQFPADEYEALEAKLFSK